MPLFKKDPLQITTFQSYGDAEHFYVRGRALEDEGIDLSKRNFLQLLRNTWKRFETDEVPHASLQIKLPDNRIVYTETDANGYFKVDEPLTNLKELSNNEGWLTYEIGFQNRAAHGWIQNDNRFQGEMLIPATNSSFGVISDIDDTILHTGVTSTFKWRLVFNTFFRNAESRSPLEGAAAFYHQLHRGGTGKEANPIFYVSHSPWNLYRYLDLFLSHNNFPKGPILLRDMQDMLGKKEEGEKPQKQKEIIDILNAYPTKQFVLIGDGGEHDADIYIEIAQQFPNRIKAIYLRSVKHKKKMLRIEGLFKSYEDTPALLVKTGEDAIAHAKQLGLVQ